MGRRGRQIDFSDLLGPDDHPDYDPDKRTPRYTGNCGADLNRYFAGLPPLETLNGVRDTLKLESPLLMREEPFGGYTAEWAYELDKNKLTFLLSVPPDRLKEGRAEHGLDFDSHLKRLCEYLHHTIEQRCKQTDAFKGVKFDASCGFCESAQPCGPDGGNKEDPGMIRSAMQLYPVNEEQVKAFENVMCQLAKEIPDHGAFHDFSTRYQEEDRQKRRDATRKWLEPVTREVADLFAVEKNITLTDEERGALADTLSRAKENTSNATWCMRRSHEKIVEANRNGMAGPVEAFFAQKGASISPGDREKIWSAINTGRGNMKGSPW